MITVPSIKTLPSARLYQDSSQAELIYVDLLEPAPMRAQPARWMPMTERDAYLAGEVRFGPGSEGFGDIPALVTGQRLLPMPWAVSPVRVWYREGERARVVAAGSTSGFGASNAVFSGAAPLSAMISPVHIGAELSCPARLSRARLRGSGDARGLSAPLMGGVYSGDDGWDVTLGDALIRRLEALLESGALALSVEGDDLTPEELAELRELALLEWAHRLRAATAPDMTLVFPLTALGDARWAAPDSMRIEWRSGDTVTLRAIRVLRCARLE